MGIEVFQPSCVNDDVIVRIFSYPEARESRFPDEVDKMVRICWEEYS